MAVIRYVVKRRIVNDVALFIRGGVKARIWDGIVGCCTNPPLLRRRLISDSVFRIIFHCRMGVKLAARAVNNVNGQFTLCLQLLEMSSHR